MNHLLSVENLRIVFNTRHGQTVAVDNLSFDLNAGDTLAIVGESGSGKSVACYSLLGLIPSPPGKIESGAAVFKGQDLLQLNEDQLRKIRGNKIAMIFQDPMTSLNPYMRIVDQLVESLKQHHQVSKKEAREKAIAALIDVGIQDAEKRIDDYPHQFSGGMRQRVMIAMALMAEPELLIADEPTTALDVTVQAQILKLIKDIQIKRQLAVIFITHDLAVAAQISDHILVMEKGKQIEYGDTQGLFSASVQPYTQKLLSSVLRSAKTFPSLVRQDEKPLVEIHQLKTSYNLSDDSIFNFKKSRKVVLQNLNLDIYKGEILGVVGESGSGKSTLGRSIIRLLEADEGKVLFEGRNLLEMDYSDLKIARRDFQMIFQDPYASLDPRMTVFDTLAEPLLHHKLANKGNIEEQVNALMDDVGLEPAAIRKYPHEFSGGQRQRIAIARAISLKPKLIIADEPVSALDVTIRAQILALLLELTQKHQLTLLFISHDMSVIRYLCDRVVVMKDGKLIEQGATEDLFNHPQEVYTQQLLAAVPILSVNSKL
ncbi:MAG: ABC transporter ATP-binding protein [Cellvibrio sp.]|nr:ABC transporter ATP-binding protein [Cellvibrio sp.]